MKAAPDAITQLQQVADRIERELICCDAFAKHEVGSSHQICYWAGASRAIVLDRIWELQRGD